MQLQMPKITTDQLTAKELSLYKNLSHKPYGIALATRVTEKLMNAPDLHHGLYHAHRDYCGLGFFYENKVFKLTTVNDGYGPDTTIASVDSKTGFLACLAEENDQSMSLYGEKFNNQTITRIRLQWYLEPDYSPVWNSYCLYLKTI